MRKNLEKKLSLNKRTIADLGKDQMRAVYGGATDGTLCCETDPSYNSCDTACNTELDCTDSCTFTLGC